MEEANLVSIPQLPHTQNITSFYSFRHFTVLLLLLLILLLLLLSKICGRSSFCICHRYGHPVVLYILPLLLPLFGTNGTTFYSLNVTLVEAFFFFLLSVFHVCVYFSFRNDKIHFYDSRRISRLFDADNMCSARI